MIKLYFILTEFILIFDIVVLTPLDMLIVTQTFTHKRKKGGAFFLAVLFCVLHNQLLYSQYKTEWLFTIGNAASTEYINSLATDINENVYAIGAFSGTMDVDPGPSVNNITASFGQDVYVVKYDKDGNYIWGFSLGGVTSSDNGKAITVDKAGNFFYITGFFTGPTMDLDPGPGVFNVSNPLGNEQTFVAKFDLNGNFVCGLSFSSGRNFPRTISKVVNGELIVAGDFHGTVDFDPGIGVNNLTADANGDIYMAKIDQNCALVWVKTIGGGDRERLLSVEQGNNGDIYVGGDFLGTADFDPGAGTVTKSAAGTHPDMFFGKYTSAGNYNWINVFTTSINFENTAFGVAPDNNNDLVVCGRYRGTIDFDPGIGTQNLSSANRTSGFFGKYYSTNGALKWIKAVSPPSSSYLEFNSLTMDASFNIYLRGSCILVPSTTPLNIDPNGGIYNLYSCWPNYMNIIAEYDSLGNIVCGNTFCPATFLQNFNSDKLIDVPSQNSIYTVGTNNGATITTSQCEPPAPVQSNGGSDIAIIKFKKKTEAAFTAAKDSICFGDSLLLKASGGVVYTWNTGATSDSIFAKPAVTTTYTVVVSDNCSCTQPDTSVFTVKVNATAGPTISGDLEICSGDTATLIANGQGPYVWSTGDSLNQINVSPPFTTVYQLSLGGICPSSPDNFTVTVNPLPPVDAGNDQIVIKGSTVSLQASGALTYTWTPAQGLSCSNCSNPTVIAEETTTYCVYGIDAKGCKQNNCMDIIVYEETADCMGIYVPNAFSPNGDGQNDVYYLQSNCIKNLLFAIYNRWGEKVFETNNIAIGWDGLYKNKLMDTSVFSYTLTATFTNGEEITESGNISLIR